MHSERVVFGGTTAPRAPQDKASMLVAQSLEQTDEASGSAPACEPMLSGVATSEAIRFRLGSRSFGAQVQARGLAAVTAIAPW